MKPSGRSRVLHPFVPFAADAAALGGNFWACLLAEHHPKSNEFERGEKPVVILPVDHDWVIGRQKLLADPGESLLVQILPSLAQQIDLKKVIGQHNKDDLVDDQREGPGSKMGQVAKAFEWTIPFLGA